MGSSFGCNQAHENDQKGGMLMVAAMMLEQLLQIAKTGQAVTPGIAVTPQQLNDLYKTTWKEAFKEGRRDARELCGCLGEEE